MGSRVPNAVQPFPQSKAEQCTHYPFAELPPDAHIAD